MSPSFMFLESEHHWISRLCYNHGTSSDYIKVKSFKIAGSGIFIAIETINSLSRHKFSFKK